MTESRQSTSSADQSTKATDDLSPEELTELREAFRVFDQDGDVRREERLVFFSKLIILREQSLWQVFLSQSS